MTERSIRQTVGRIRHRQGRQTAEVWAFQRGYSVKFGKDGIEVKPLV